MAQADEIRAILDEAMRELDRLARLELERVGQGLLRWLQELWPRMPCATWLDEFNRIVANLARDQVFVEEQSRQAFIAWLSAVNASAAVAQTERTAASGLAPDAPPADGDSSDNAPVLQRPPADRPSPRLEKLLREVLAQIEKLPPEKWLEEVRKLLDHVDLPPDVEARILEYYTWLHQLLKQPWGKLHEPGPIVPSPVRPETNQELLLRIAAGLDKLIAEGRLDELLDALRELVRRIPELMPEATRGGELEKLARELQEILNQFLDLLALLPPEAGDVAIELLQLALDIAGMFPGPGDIFDLVAAVVSARRGEWLDAIISVGSALFLAGIALGMAKITKRLKKLASLIARLKGPAREILSNLIEGIAKAVKDIPLTSVHAAIEGLKGFLKRLGELLGKTIERLKRTKPNAPSNLFKGGRWVPESTAGWSARAKAYQQQITGRPAGTAFELNGVRFDGHDAVGLLEAKGPGYAWAVQNGQFRQGYKGAAGMLGQAEKEIAASQGLPITWHVAEETNAEAIRNLFRDNGITRINVVFTPPMP